MWALALSDWILNVQVRRAWVKPSGPGSDSGSSGKSSDSVGSSSSGAENAAAAASNVSTPRARLRVIDEWLLNGCLHCKLQVLVENRMGMPRESWPFINQSAGSTTPRLSTASFICSHFVSKRSL